MSRLTEKQQDRLLSAVSEYGAACDKAGQTWVGVFREKATWDQHDADRRRALAAFKVVAGLVISGRDDVVKIQSLAPDGHEAVEATR